MYSSLPVHPFAAMFPMRADDDLDAMAESIRANGLRFPVVLGMAAIDDGSEPMLCVVDGRNRIEACKRAKVQPHTITLNGEDQDAYIADANLERRDLTKGQKAMLIAVRFGDERKGGRGKTASTNYAESSQLSVRRVQQARAVKEYCPEMIDSVIDGKTGLDEAYAEAQRRRQLGQATDTRYEALRESDPDLADQVNEETLKLNEAEAAARVRREEEESTLRSYAQTVKDISRYITAFGKPGIEQLARLYVSNPERFHTDNLIGDLDVWIAIATAIKEKINEQAR
ncbi:ParB N-terminal domain-containing protein [Paraburkholderia sediminicola]|uniref:ParB N-terminal domain-containing protein n=1 Tax=Paraburkholderia sediminicola TaxID=458836 RepID=UPI0038BB1868